MRPTVGAGTPPGPGSRGTPPDGSPGRPLPGPVTRQEFQVRAASRRRRGDVPLRVGGRKGRGAASRPHPCTGATGRGSSGDLDAPSLGLRGLGYAHGQHAVVQPGADVVRVDVGGEGHRVLKATHAAGSPTQDARALLLLDLAGDGQPAVAECSRSSCPPSSPRGSTRSTPHHGGHLVGAEPGHVRALRSPGRATREEAAQGFKAVNALPIPWVEAVDISNAVLFLASDESRHITGTTMQVDAAGTAPYKIPHEA